MFTALETIPLMKGKSRDLRVLFADTANKALSQGRSTDEAVFKALAVVKQKEQRKIKKYVKPSVPAHLAAILNIRSASNLAQEAQEELEKAKATADSQQTSNDVVGAEFDSKGRLTLKLKDGKTITSNVAPITAVETSVVVIGENGQPVATGTGLAHGVDGGSATSVFKVLEEVDGGAATSVIQPSENIDGGTSSG